MTQSSWEQTKARSNYHFDNFRMHPTLDAVDRIGSIFINWTDQQLERIIQESKEATWRTRGNPIKEAKVRSEQEHLAEEYDLEHQGYDKDYVVSNLNWEIPDNLMDIAKSFHLQNVMVRLHVQHPGQVWNLHLDKLDKWCPDDPSKVSRYMIQLTDWEPGQFWSYGNYNYHQWRAGDLTSFDWMNVPHSTANASHHPRVTLQITGVRTDATDDFIEVVRHLKGKSYFCKRYSFYESA